MKFILGDRGSGVTTDIIAEAAKCGGVIVCPTYTQANYICRLAEDIGIDNIDVVTINDVCGSHALEDYPDAHIFISDVKDVLWVLLQNYGATGNIEMMSASM